LNRLIDYWKRFKESRYFLKVVSVFLSVLLWLFVLNSQPIEIRKKIKIQYIMPEEMSFIKEPVREVIVIFRGPRAYARGKKFDHKFVIIDLSDSSSRQRVKIEKKIKESNIPISFGLDLESFSPKNLVLELDRTIYKTVPLIIDFEGKVKEGLRLISSTIRPKGMAIEGPLELMRKFRKIKTVPIYLDELSGQVEKEVLLQDLPRGIKLKEKRFTVTVNTEIRPIEARVINKKLKIRFLSSQRKFSTLTKEVNVKVSLPEEQQGSNSLDGLAVIADIPEGSVGRVAIDLRVIIPKELQLLEISPQKIYVNIKK